MKMKSLSLCATMLGLSITAASLQAQAPNLLNYQGRLATGGAAAEGVFAMTFLIYASPAGGSPLWEEVQSVTVSKGQFNVLLGQNEPLPNALFHGTGDRYLATKVGNDTEMLPRFRLVSTAFAIRAHQADGVADDAITGAKIASGHVVKSLNNLRDDVSLAAGSNVSIAASGNTLTISATPGGGGGDITAVTAGNGLNGGGATGDVTLALNTAFTDAQYINEGQAEAVTSAMLQDNAATASKILPNLVASINGVSNDGGNINLVAGNSNITISPNDGDNTIAISATGGGGLSLPFSGQASSSSDAFAITQNGIGRAANFEVNNTSSNGAAVRSSTNSANNVAAIFCTNSGAGVGGSFQIANVNNSNTALEGETNGTGFAGEFFGTGNSSRGVRITVPAGQTGLAIVGGSKNAVVATSQGARLLYSEEASEVWFTDYGFGRLQNGHAVIAIDPIFAETANLNEPYHVFVQSYGNAEVYVSQRTPTAFTVLLREGEANVDFSYRVVAKRRGYERNRLERAPWAEDDPNLYPEKRAQWEAKRRAAK